MQLGRDLGATGVVTGGLFEENGQVVLKIHTEGFRPLKKDPDSFNDTTEYVRLTVTRELKDMLFQDGPNYARDPDLGIQSNGGRYDSPTCVEGPGAIRDWRPRA